MTTQIDPLWISVLQFVFKESIYSTKGKQLLQWASYHQYTFIEFYFDCLAYSGFCPGNPFLQYPEVSTSGNVILKDFCQETLSTLQTLFYFMNHVL